MLEDLIKEHIAALKENTQALVALRSEEVAAKPATKTAAKTAPLKVVEKDELEDEPEDDGLGEDPAPVAKKAAKKVAATPPAKKAAGNKDVVTLDTIRDLIRNERERLKTDVSAEAVAAHKLATREILDGIGATSVSDLAVADIAAAYKAIKAINVESPEESGDDDDL